MPCVPKISPAVGKSGPLMNPISSATDASGQSIRWITPSITSTRLWGGILVAMPTAIPDEPFTRSWGNRDGKTSGSFVDAS
ncbi:MAG: hypothetical protein BWY92_01397 [Firmicutes bacterium ADurb.BinA052]|nr:MAG: hypothetical protein BWY92_01397 [Firmicutes bacterium ADurb.BinA052]